MAPMRARENSSDGITLSRARPRERGGPRSHPWNRSQRLDPRFRENERAFAPRIAKNASSLHCLPPAARHVEKHLFQCLPPVAREQTCRRVVALDAAALHNNDAFA